MTARRKIIPYNPKLKEFARNLRNNSSKSEILLWQRIKGKQMNSYDFHRQKPIDNYIIDFFCVELMLGIELGLNILRFEDKQIFSDMENVLRTIEIYIENFEKTHTP